MTIEANFDGRSGQHGTQFEQVFSNGAFSPQSKYEFETSLQDVRQLGQNTGTTEEVGTHPPALSDAGVTIFGSVAFFDSLNGIDYSTSQSLENGAQQAGDRTKSSRATAGGAPEKDDTDLEAAVRAHLIDNPPHRTKDSSWWNQHLARMEAEEHQKTLAILEKSDPSGESVRRYRKQHMLDLPRLDAKEGERQAREARKIAGWGKDPYAFPHSRLEEILSSSKTKGVEPQVVTEQPSTTKNGARAVLVQGDNSESNAPQQGGDKGSTVENSDYAKSPGIENPTVEPYSEEKARGLIKQFGDNEYAVRQHAMETVIRMGPAALPLLRETSQTKQELEVKYRVKTAIESIEQNQYNQKLDTYMKQFETMDGLFLAAGLDFNEDHLTIDPKGRLLQSILIDPPPKTLSKSERSQFEKMIESGDELRKDERFGKVMEDTMDSEDYNKLMVVGLSTRTREVYARALSGTGDPDDASKGLKLLQEQMKISEGFEPGDAFLDTAYRLGGFQNQEFVKAFSDLGFDPETIRPYGLGRLWFF